MLCNGFNIQIKQKIVTIFKKYSISKSKLMNYNEFEFEKSLEALSIEMFEFKKKFLKEKLVKEKEKLKQIEIKENQSIEDDNIKKIFEEELNENNKLIKFSSIKWRKKEKIFLYKKNTIKNEIAIIKNEYKNSLKKSIKEVIEEFYDYLELDTNDKKYRAKMKSYKESPLKLHNLKIKKKYMNIDFHSNNENIKTITNRIKTNKGKKKFI